jgi:hypothetical protein
MKMLLFGPLHKNDAQSFCVSRKLKCALKIELRRSNKIMNQHHHIVDGKKPRVEDSLSVQVWNIISAIRKRC